MNVQTMIQQIAFRLGNRKGMEQTILLEINLAQSRLEKDPRVDWWFLLQTRSIPLVDGAFLFPEDVERIADQSVPLLYIDGVDTPPIKLKRCYPEYGEFVETLFEDSMFYSVVGREFKVYPTPLEACTVKVQFVSKQSVLVLDEPAVLSNGWTEHAYSLLMNKAGIPLAQAIQNEVALQNFSADFATAYTEASLETYARADFNFSQVRS